MMRILGAVIAGLAGLAFGSFLNVCLTRWTAGESVVEPRSHCRTCQRTLRWWENIPLASYVFLRGRCRGCGAAIGVRYLIVEAAVGGLWALEAYRSIPAFPEAVSTEILWYQLGAGIGLMIFFWLLIALAVLDAEHLWLPDWLTWTGIVLGVFGWVMWFAFTVHTVQEYGHPVPSIWSALESSAFVRFSGLLFPPALLWLVRWLYWLIRRREGLGMGDVKLMALLGAWLGLPDALVALFIAVLLGGVAAIVHIATRKTGMNEAGAAPLPFGTFLCVGGIVSALWGEAILRAYLRLAGFS